METWVTWFLIIFWAIVMLAFVIGAGECIAYYFWVKDLNKKTLKRRHHDH